MGLRATAKSKGKVSAMQRLNRFVLRGCVMLSISVIAWGCDSFFEVELPGQLVAADLDNPELAETLALGAQGDFECAFRGYLLKQLLWSGVYTFLGAEREWFLTEQRSIGVREGGDADCRNNREPVWLPMQIVRGQADLAIDLIQGFPAGSVDSPEYLIAKSFLYKAYATEMLSEDYCGIVFNGDGVERPREEGFQTASDLFTSALDYAGQVTGSKATAAADITNMALVGRARAKLNLGDGQGAVADASLVAPGFVGYLTYEEGGDLRREWYVEGQILDDDAAVRPHYTNLTVGGEPDPRVPLEDLGEDRPGVEHWKQLKYPTGGTWIPFSTWREAQLMIAEVEGGQQAVDIINNLRATVADLDWVDDSHPGLAPFASSDPVEIQAQVLEERRRELFLQGTKIGDDLRTGEWVNWPSGTTAGGLPIDTNASCIPVPRIETS